MPRSKMQKMVHQPPLFTSFKPMGVPRNALNSLPLTLDEYEAIRLADYLGMDHAEAAEEMEISRSTFTRLIEQARKKTAQFLVEGKELYIEGGNVHFRGNILRCKDCGHMFNTDIRSSVSKCPECESGNLINLAGGFGHGRCCVRHQSRGN
ncbi:MAG: DUF134 domain-containing protein [Calditrichaceae bacterium]|jgi:uncharacterized protein